MRCLVLVLLAGLAVAGEGSLWERYGPFADPGAVELVPLKDLSEQVVKGEGEGAPAWQVALDDGAVLRFVGTEKDFAVDLQKGEEVLLAPSPFPSPFKPQVQSADLNGDGTVDYWLNGWSGGCGLAGNRTHNAFVLSSPEGYTFHAIDSFNAEPGCFVLLDGRACFVHTAFGGESECTDGKDHHFWIYHLVRLGPEPVAIANELHDGFPKIVWYSFADNHAETTLLTDEQKATLLAEARAEIFPNREP